MANIKITDLGTIADPTSTDVLPIVDVIGDVTNKISIEELLKNAAAGTAAAPGIAFDSDPDTGVYNSGANALAFSTGGTGRLFIDSSGNLGVGTSTPNYLLDVEKADAGARINALTGNSSVYLTCSDNAGISTLFLGDAASPTTGQIKYRNSGDSLAFEVNGSERLRIDGAGRVMIGTSSNNGGFLTVDSGGAQNLVIRDNGIETHKFNGNASIAINYNGYANGTTQFRDFVIWNGKQQHIATFDGSSRNVGIGVTSPNAKLHVAGTIQSSVGSHTAQMYSDGGASFFTSVGAYPSVFYTNGSERLRIDASGNVGIRTSAPSYALDISSTDANQLRIRGTADNPLIMDATDSGPCYVSVLRAGTRVAYYGFGGSGNDFYLINETSTGSIALGTNSTERFRIGPAGQFGLSGANYGTSGQVLTSNGSASAPTWQTPSGGGGGLYDDYAIFQHTTSSGTDGGATSSSTWNTRPINTTAVSQTWASISSNQITLSAGTYSIDWQETIYRSDATQSRLRNITDSTTAALGLAYRSDGVGGGFGKTTIASSKTFELQHYTASNDSSGLGLDAGSGENNVFATIKITKHV